MSLNQVTALICAYNAEKTIGRAIASVIEQVDAVIVVDDGSTDNTAHEVERLRHEKVTLIKAPTNQGIGASRHMALEQCQSDYAIWVDADDECLPNRVETLLPYLIEGYGWVYDSIELYDGKTNSFSKNLIIPDFLFKPDGIYHQLARNYIPSIGFPMINVGQARRVGFDSSFRHGEDYDHFLRALTSGGKISLSQDVTHRMYDYPSSLSRQLNTQNQFVDLGMKKQKKNLLTNLLSNSSLSKQEQLSILLLRLLKTKDVHALSEVISSSERLSIEMNLDFNWLIQFSKGILAYHKNDYSLSIKAFQNAASLQKSADVSNNIGVLSELLGENGQQYFRNALKLFPGYKDAKLNLHDGELRMTIVPLRKYQSRDQYD